MTTRSKAALLFVALTVSGCGSSHIVSRLDDDERAEFAALCQELRGRKVRVGGWDAGWDKGGSLDDDAQQAVALIGIVPVSVPDGETPDVAVSGAPLGGCMNPMLGSAITLGVLPYARSGGHDRICRFPGEDGAPPEIVQFDSDDTQVFGWLALPLAVLPSWNVFVGWGDRERQRGGVVERLSLFLARELAKRPVGRPD